MNAIRFEIGEFEFSSGMREKGIRILIDGLDLIEMVREYERPFAEEEGHPDLAGQYAGLHPEAECDRRHTVFLGTRGFDWGEGRGAIFTCGDCSEEGCWPLLCRVVVGEHTVTWSDFKQPHRTGRVFSLAPGMTVGVPKLWDYSDFGPFVFDRKQYLEAAEMLWTCDGRFDPYFDRVELTPGRSVSLLDLTFTVPEGWSGSQLVPIRGLPYPGAVEAIDLTAPTDLLSTPLVILAYPPGVDGYSASGIPFRFESESHVAPETWGRLAGGSDPELSSTTFNGQTSLIARIIRAGGIIEAYATGLRDVSRDVVMSYVETMIASLSVDYPRERAATADRAKYDAVLDKVRDVPPDAGDE